MSKQITFGKYSGQTAKEVAIADRDYATWAASNLRSDFWRKEFSQALIDAKNATVEEVIAATVGDDAPDYAKEMVRKDIALATNRKSKRDALLTQYAEIAGVSAEKFALIVNSMTINGTEPQDLNPANFSSRERYQAMRDCLSAIYNL